MWRKWSRDSKDIFRFGQNARPDEWRERFRADELDPAAQASFEQLGQCKETRVGFGARGELDEDVDVTAVVRLPAQDRTEQGEAAYAQGPDLRLAFGKTLDGLDAVPHWRRHVDSVPQSEAQS